MSIQALAAGVRPPMRGEVLTRSIPAAIEVYAIPASWQGQGVEWSCSGGSCYVVFHTAIAITITPADRAALAGAVLTADPDNTQLYADGQVGYAQILRGLALTHFAILGPTAAGFITFRRATFTQEELNR